MATQKVLLTYARQILVGNNDVKRTHLKTAALNHGRSVQQVSKASTMRLALWVSKGTSAI